MLIYFCFFIRIVIFFMFLVVCVFSACLVLISARIMVPLIILHTRSSQNLTKKSFFLFIYHNYNINSPFLFSLSLANIKYSSQSHTDNWLLFAFSGRYIIWKNKKLKLKYILKGREIKKVIFIYSMKSDLFIVSLFSFLLSSTPDFLFHIRIKNVTIKVKFWSNHTKETYPYFSSNSMNTSAGQVKSLVNHCVLSIL